MLYLNEETVLKLLKWEETVSAIEAAMKSVSKARAFQNPRTFTNIPGTNNVLLTMPGYLQNLNFGALACKLVTSFPNNVKLPNSVSTINANIALFDEETGILKALIAATEITKWRTAAASVVATKNLCSRNSNQLKILSILGCGEQGNIHAAAFLHLFNFDEIRLWNRTTEKARKLANDYNQKLGRTLFKFFENVEDCVKNADVIITATYSSSPFVKKEWIKKGVHINAVGAGQNHFSELDEAIYLTADVYIDYWPGAKKELAGLESLGVRFKGEIGSVIAGDLTPGNDLDKVTVFQSLGMAVQDCAMARLVYDLYEKDTHTADN